MEFYSCAGDIYAEMRLEFVDFGIEICQILAVLRCWDCFSHLE